MKTKYCSRCNQKLPVNKFYARSRSKDGLMSQCIECIKLYKHSRQQQNKEYRDRYNESHGGYKMIWANATISKHKKRVDINFTALELLDRIKETHKCELCGVELSWEANKKRIISNSPTIDNMNLCNKLSIGDIQIVCHKCNRTKNNRTYNEFINYCKTIIINNSDIIDIIYPNRNSMVN